jgi:hypothetical protein
MFLGWRKKEREVERNITVLVIETGIGIIRQGAILGFRGIFIET